MGVNTQAEARVLGGRPLREDSLLTRAGQRGPHVGVDREASAWQQLRVGIGDFDKAAGLAVLSGDLQRTVAAGFYFLFDKAGAERVFITVDDPHSVGGSARGAFRTHHETQVIAGFYTQAVAVAG